MFNLNHMHVFYAVVLEGSYKKGATRLGIKQPQVSKHIQSLERELNTTLLRRRQRGGLTLTEKGRTVFESVRKIMSEVNVIEEGVDAKGQEHVSGTIRVLTTMGTTHLWLIKKIGQFMANNDKIQFKILGTDDYISLLRHEADIAIGPTTENSFDIIKRKIITFQTGLFASRQYLEKWGKPKTVSDLDSHKLISFYHGDKINRGDIDWHLKIGRPPHHPRKPFLTVNSAIGQFEAANNHMGIIAIDAAYPYISGSNLVQILKDYDSVEVDVFLMLKEQDLNVPKIKAFIEYLDEEK